MTNCVKPDLRKRVSRVFKWVSNRQKAPTQVVPRSDDVFLVSYPRSGNTWVRFLLANLMRNSTIGGVDFYTVNAYVPELGRHNDVISRMTGPRVIKSHATFSKNFSNVIYIIRDARDVYISYYYFLRHRIPENVGFTEFMADLRGYVPLLWSEHVDSWLLAPRKPHLLLVRYEDMVEDCARELHRMVEFAGMSVTEEAIQEAVRLSSLKEMQSLEKARGRPYQAEAPSQFIRNGQPGEWRFHFGEHERRVFPARERAALVRWGYATDTSW